LLVRFERPGKKGWKRNTWALDWNEKSKIRNLLQPEEYRHIFDQLTLLPKEINALIKYTNQKLAI